MASLMMKLMSAAPSRNLAKNFVAPVVSDGLRCLQTTAARCSYDEDGKTTVTILNKNFDYGLMIDNMSEQGFVLNNGIRTVGPLILFPKTMLSWNIACSEDMNEDSFSLLLNMHPKLDVVVVGLDDNYPANSPIVKKVKDIFRKHKINVEVLPTYKACSTYNFLNAENRYAAAAMIPPKLLKVENLLLKDGQKGEDIPIPQGEDVPELEEIGNRKQQRLDGKEHKALKDPAFEDDWKFERELAKQVYNKPEKKVGLINTEIDEINVDDLRKNKNIQESFKIRQPWKDESFKNVSRDPKGKKEDKK
ncbi:uncharacterized protein LOC106649688 [Trichogramma pretiosum]|uniref:uncharacterized protein LOC106649688 n=1 Tax=Trichogramma pretiosum TaxID=7493 RepID=UPI0006C965E9|nr:uncharacterized protein LOC106649688 [Trichogramma pretiosum]